MKKNVLIFAFISFGLFASAQTNPSIEWVSIPAGTFSMGSPNSEVDRSDDETQHQVTLSAFKMSKYEITFEQYDLFCKATHRKKPKDEGLGRGEIPVINVSWIDANAFAEWMGCRLPSEAEWEYACRAGTTTPFNVGISLSTKDANFSPAPTGQYRGSDLIAGRPKNVGSYTPNNWGLYDMHGNVREWCNDWYGEYSDSDQINPLGPSTGIEKVFRGGDWGSKQKFCRSARRGSDTPTRKEFLTGFRIVKNE